MNTPEKTDQRILSEIVKELDRKKTVGNNAFNLIQFLNNCKAILIKMKE